MEVVEVAVFIVIPVVTTVAMSVKPLALVCASKLVLVDVEVDVRGVAEKLVQVDALAVGLAVVLCVKGSALDAVGDALGV